MFTFDNVAPLPTDWTRLTDLPGSLFPPSYQPEERRSLDAQLARHKKRERERQVEGEKQSLSLNAGGQIVIGIVFMEMVTREEMIELFQYSVHHVLPNRPEAFKHIT